MSEFAAYAAGLIDGEGYIGACYRRRASVAGRFGDFQCYIFVAVAMTDRTPLDLLAEHFGAKVYALKIERPEWKQCFRYQATGVAAEKLIRAVQPYLLVKHEQARLALEIRKTRVVGGRATPERELKREQMMGRRILLMAQIRTLNKRGIDVETNVA